MALPTRRSRRATCSPASRCRRATASRWITTPDFANRVPMLSETHAKAQDGQRRGLADLPPVASDALLALIVMANADTRPDKIDVGVGVFRDGAGNTPILKVM